MTKAQLTNQTRPARRRAVRSNVNGRGFGDPVSPAHGMRVSEALYWARYYETADGSYEWNNGVLEEKPLPDYRRIAMYDWFLTLLRSYLEVNPIAKLLHLEMGFRLAMPDKTTIRKPDLFVVRNDNPVPLGETDRSYHGICDLCVESLSDSSRDESERDTVVKKREYAVVGVKEYYILDPDGQMAFYRRNEAGAYEPLPADADGVICSSVLPGFQFRIADLYLMPPQETMAEDPVYRHYVLLKLQAEMQRAEVAEERAEVAEERAEVAEERMLAERNRAERYAALLRNLGIDVA
jgi:Uma2 family endonuclease